MTIPLANIAKDLDEITKSLSDKIRQIDFGILAFVWVFLAGGPNLPAIHITTTKQPLLGVAALCLGSLFFDLLQSIAAYLNALHVLRSAEKAKLKTTEYDKKDWRYRANMKFYTAKVVLGFGAAGWLVVLLILALF